MEKIPILPNFKFSGKKITKDLRHGGLRKKSINNVHSTIQNEMMQIIALRVLREVAQNIPDVDFYWIMCDE